MKHFYYTIWADAIYWELLRPRKWGGEILAPFALICMAQMANLMSTLLLLHVMGIESGFLDSFFQFTGHMPKLLRNLTFIIPVALINYGLVFYKRDYLKFASEQKTYGGRIYILYVTCSWALFLILLYAGSLSNG